MGSSSKGNSSASGKVRVHRRGGLFFPFGNLRDRELVKEVQRQGPALCGRQTTHLFEHERNSSTRSTRSSGAGGTRTGSAARRPSWYRRRATARFLR